MKHTKAPKIGSRVAPAGMLGFVCSKYDESGPHNPHGVCDGNYWTDSASRRRHRLPRKARS